MLTPLERYFAPYRKHIAGNRCSFVSPFGRKRIVYADWTASGRVYWPIEEYLQRSILPYVANTHTETTVTGTLMSKAYEESKRIIKEHVSAGSDDVLVFCGSGMTAAVSKLQRILGMRVPVRLADYLSDDWRHSLDESLRPVVFVTHMEHHSNYLSWLETIATVEIIRRGEDGNVDLAHFRQLLEQYRLRKNKIAAVTACSNVTGIRTPYPEIARLIHRHGGYCFVDFASSAPYVDIRMNAAEKDACLDAIYFSPHKFLGGPGTPGVLIFKKALYRNTTPDAPGGGTVQYTNPWGEREYVDDIEQREDGGTPPFLQAIRAAMCIRLKEAMGVNRIQAREEEMVQMILPRLQDMQGITVLEGNVADRQGVFAFLVDGAHYNLVVRLLNDRFGIQTRGGCSCAGPYGHHLLNVDRRGSHEIRDSILAGDQSRKPGWVRLSVHPTMTNAEIAYILDAIRATAANFPEWADDYRYDARSNEFNFRAAGNGCEQQIVTEWLEGFQCPPYDVRAGSPCPLR